MWEWWGGEATVRHYKAGNFNWYVDQLPPTLPPASLPGPPTPPPQL